MIIMGTIFFALFVFGLVSLVIANRSLAKIARETAKTRGKLSELADTVYDLEDIALRADNRERIEFEERRSLPSATVRGTGLQE